MSINTANLLLSVMIIVSEYAMARVTMTQSNSEVIVGGTTHMSCVTSLPKEIYWRHFPIGGPAHEQKEVYSYGRMHSPYKDRFEMQINRTTGFYQLVIPRVELTDSGVYTCQEDEGIGDSAQAEVTVLEAGPTCTSTKNPIELIGPNSCNKEQENLTLACSVAYRGNIEPVLEWKLVGADETITQGLHVEKAENRITYHLTMSSQPALDGSSFICRTTETQYNCTSDVINIIYVISSNFTQKATIGDTVLCTATTNESCSYRWKWFKGDDTLTASNNRTLIPKQSGNFRCEAECFIRKQPCSITAMFAYVEDGNATSTTGDTELGPGYAALIAIAVVLTACVVVIIVLLYVFRKRSLVFLAHPAPYKETEVIMETPKETEVLLMEIATPDAVDSQLELSAELSSLPIITDQNMVDSLTINQYFIDRGTSGAIYGPFRWKDKKCALKQILFSPDALTKELEENILQKANRCKELNHRHLVKVFEVWFPAPALYNLMEYAEGKSLDKFLRPRDAVYPLPPFSLEIVKDWALQIADGMKYLHYNDLVHRNLKAAHVLVMESSDVSPNTLKLGSYTLITKHDHATVMSAKGTLAWMAPECIRSEPFSKLSDVWSYGVTVWEILTRDLPYKEVRKETDLVRAAINKTLKLKIPESCPELLQDLLTSCLNHEVDKRPSFTEICDYLRSKRFVTDSSLVQP